MSITTLYKITTLENFYYSYFKVKFKKRLKHNENIVIGT